MCVENTMSVDSIRQLQSHARAYICKFFPALGGTIDTPRLPRHGVFGWANQGGGGGLKKMIVGLKNETGPIYVCS